MTAREFWGSAPKLIVGMLDEDKKIALNKMKAYAFLVRGGKLDDEPAYDPFGM